MEECKTPMDETDDALTLYSVTTFSTNYTQSNNIGPGRTLDRMFQFWGKKLEHSLGRAVEIFGYRPAAIGGRIERRARKLSFPKAAEKKTGLSGALTGAKRLIRRYRLKRDCKRLLRYLKMDVPSRQNEALEVLIQICSSEQAVRKEMLELSAREILQTLNQKLMYISEHIFPELRKRAMDAYKLFAQESLQIKEAQQGLPLHPALVHPITPNDAVSRFVDRIIQSFQVGDSKATSIFLWWRAVEHPVDKKSSKETLPRCFTSDSGYPFFMIQIEQNEGMLALRLETRLNVDFQTVHCSMHSSNLELLQAHSIHLHTLRMPQANMGRAGATSMTSVDDTFCPLLIDLVPNYSLNVEHLLILWLLSRRRSKWTLLAFVLIWFCIGDMKCKV